MNFIRRNAAASVAEVESYLQAGQESRVAFLPAKTGKQPLAETLAALANADGGAVLLGVTARGALQAGCRRPALRELVIEAGLLTDPPLILPSPQAVTHGRGRWWSCRCPKGCPTSTVSRASI
jgi:predicted HTH transcriptional regulator